MEGGGGRGKEVVEGGRRRGKEVGEEGYYCSGRELVEYLLFQYESKAKTNYWRAKIENLS